MMTLRTSREPHPLQGKTVELNETASDPLRHAVIPGAHFWIRDWYVNMDPDAIEPLVVPRNWAEKWFLRRAEEVGLDHSDLVYGKIGGLGHLVHVSELGKEVKS